MQPQAKELIGVLGQLAELLESEGEARWSKQMRDAARRLEEEAPAGVGLLLDAYRGADSFRSFAFGQKDGERRPDAPPGLDKNRVLDNLRRRAHVLADFIQRS
jgi:hypothetical protein